jgi:5-methylcytosine-specific restriction endonuclease McrA
MSVTYISPDVRSQVGEIAEHRCEYCQTQEMIVGMPLEVEHIVPEAQGGGSDETNLCLACPRCNRYNMESIPKKGGLCSDWECP